MPRNGFNYDRAKVSAETGLNCEDESLAQQQFAEEVDINTILRRFHLTGELPVDARRPTFGDFAEVVDFQTAMNAIAEARESFDAMPAEVRARFHHDPQEFLEFTSDDANLEEMRKLGLAVPAAVPPAPPAAIHVIVDPVAPSTTPPGSTVST